MQLPPFSEAISRAPKNGQPQNPYAVEFLHKKIAQFSDNALHSTWQFVGFRSPPPNRNIHILQLTTPYRAKFIAPVMSVVADSSFSINPVSSSQQHLSKIQERFDTNTWRLLPLVLRKRLQDNKNTPKITYWCAKN